MKKSIVILMLSGLMIMASSFVSPAQDTDASKSKKAKVVLKIKKDNKGQTTVIDTVFDLSAPGGQREFDEAMKQYEAEMDRMDDELKNIDAALTAKDAELAALRDQLAWHLDQRRHYLCVVPQPGLCHSLERWQCNLAISSQSWARNFLRCACSSRR